MRQTANILSFREFQKANTLFDAATAVVIGSFVPIDIKGITAGRNSMGAVFKSGLTKLANGTAARMSVKVVAKGVASGFAGDLAISIALGIRNFLVDLFGGCACACA